MLASLVELWACFAAVKAPDKTFVQYILLSARTELDKGVVRYQRLIDSLASFWLNHLCLRGLLIA